MSWFKEFILCSQLIQRASMKILGITPPELMGTIVNKMVRGLSQRITGITALHGQMSKVSPYIEKLLECSRSTSMT
jgi:hypothetical protein